MKRPKKQRVTQGQLAIKTGDDILVRLDSGIRMSAKAASEPWQLGHGDWVIKVEGISGGYDLSRVETRK